MRWQRVLTLLLLCGLSTTPFFSLEQSSDDGLTASSVPQCGTREAGGSASVREARRHRSAAGARADEIRKNL